LINIEYTISPQESANATLDFLTNRPIMSFMFTFMKYSCVLLCAGFALTLYQKQTRPQDFMAVLFAIGWILFYKPINRWIIKSTLKGRKFAEAAHSFKIDQKSIFCKLPSGQPQHIEWKKVKFILQNKDGYIVPLTGITNAGKFLWLPFRGFKESTMQEDFVTLVQQLKLKFKRLPS
jgi:hypothetical protein